MIWLLCKRKPELGPKTPCSAFRDTAHSLLRIIPIILLFLFVICGVFFGFFTTTESGAFGAFGAIIIGAVTRKLNGKSLKRAIMETALMCGMCFFMMAGTFMFVSFMTMSRVTFFITSFVTGLNAPLWVTMIIVTLLYMILGCFLPEIPMMALTIPILYPALKALGLDPIWLGAFLVKLMAIATVSPPIGMCCFVLSGVTKKSLKTVFQGVIPFLLVDAFILLLLAVFPQLATFLPSMMQ